MKKLVKLVVVIGIFTIFAANSLISQTVRFRPKHNIEKTDLKLDSVRAIQKNGSLEFTIKTIYFDFDTLIKSEIKVDNPNTNKQLSFLTDNIVILPLILESNGEISVEAYNILGSKAGSCTINGFEGINNLMMDISGFDKGLYFLKVQSGSENTMLKVMKENTGNGNYNNFSIYNEYNFLPMPVIDLNRLLADYKFDFIAYSKGYFPDTLRNVVLKNDTTLEFYLEERNPLIDPISDTVYVFSTINIKGIISGEFEIKVSSNTENNIKTETKKVSVNKIFTQKFKPIGVVTIKSNFYYDDDYIIIEFNYKNRTCNILEYKEYFEDYYMKKNINFKASNVPYILNNNNELIIDIRGDKITYMEFSSLVREFLTEVNQRYTHTTLEKFNPEMSSVKIVCKPK